MEEGRRGALRRRAVSQGKEEIEQDRRKREVSSGGHRICCIPCGHVYDRSCLEALLARCGAKAAKCLWCAREFKDEDMLNLYLDHTEEQMMKDDDATLQQQAPAARMHTEEQQEAAWQKTVAEKAAEAQQRAVLARERVGLARKMEECGSQGLNHDAADILNLCDDSSSHQQASTSRSSHVVVAEDKNEKQVAHDAAAMMDADDIARENAEMNQEAANVLNAAQSNVEIARQNAEFARQNAEVARQNADMAQGNVEIARKALKMARLTVLFAVIIPLVMAALFYYLF